MGDPDKEIAKKVFGNVCRYCVHYGECPDFLEGLLKPETLEKWKNMDEREGCGWFELTHDARVELNEKGYYYSDKLGRWVRAIVLECEEATSVKIDDGTEKDKKSKKETVLNYKGMGLKDSPETTIDWLIMMIIAFLVSNLVDPNIRWLIFSMTIICLGYIYSLWSKGTKTRGMDMWCDDKGIIELKEHERDRR